MKKQRNHNTVKTGTASMAVCAILTEPRMVSAIVNQLAHRHNENSGSFEKTQPGWQAFHSSSVEAYASGELHLIKNSDPVTLSFDASFLFTCIKAKGETYNLTWANSLS